MIIHIKSPTRVDLAGGTLDCWPLYSFVGPCWTVNLSIDIFTEVKLSARDDKKIEVHLRDLSYQKTFSHVKALQESDDSQVHLIKTCVEYLQPEMGFSLETHSQSPVGGGLGGSSSLLISLLKAFGQLYARTWDVSELVNVAHNIEAKLLHTPTGTQDYFPAACPGLNAIEYSAAGFRLEPLTCDINFFKDHMFLVYTGKPHHSGINNWQVIKDAVEKKSGILDTLRGLAEVSQQTKEVCVSGTWEKFPELLREEYRLRTQLSAAFVSPEIVALEKLALREGAEAVKICGAGGGGCVMIWCPPETKNKVAARCQAQGFQVLQVSPVSG